MKMPTPIDRSRRLTVPWNVNGDSWLGAPASLPAGCNRRNSPAGMPALPAGVRAFTLIECLVYIGLFAVLLGLGADVAKASIALSRHNGNLRLAIAEIAPRHG